MAEIDDLRRKLELYEQNGAAKFFYALNRKLNEMAELLNKADLSKVDLDDKDSKQFDRLFKILEKSKVVGDAAQTIQGFAGVSGNEDKDTKNPKYRITPESMAQELGDNKTQDV